MAVETKSPIHSKVLWFNILSVAAIVVTEVIATPEIKELLGGKVYILMIIGALINAGLRVVTTTPLSTSAPAPKKKLNPVDQALADDNAELF